MRNPLKGEVRRALASGAQNWGAHRKIYCKICICCPKHAMPLQKGPTYINRNWTKPCEFQMSLGIMYFRGCTSFASSHSAVFENSGHFLTRSGLTHPEVSKLVFPGSFCLSACSFLLFWVIFHEAFCLHVFSSPVFCPKLGVILLQSLCLLSKCILLFFSYNSSLPLLLFLRLLP